MDLARRPGCLGWLGREIRWRDHADGLITNRAKIDSTRLDSTRPFNAPAGLMRPRRFLGGAAVVVVSLARSASIAGSRRFTLHCHATASQHSIAASSNRSNVAGHHTPSLAQSSAHCAHTSKTGHATGSFRGSPRLLPSRDGSGLAAIPPG
ncbi:uncharacterized protein PSFLO_00188 [Pseudozyma flocculosa]|uniref:Uncharacterized protein n=1 Tax=Pseudozyma flocculosa TaxID=84751 RepID=A0A5C3ET77_9BASI|nr:uncharacterized protein PSFLO_00188 [Pseudozyma flocculosa]